jgi:hypothetical protein
MTPVEEKFVLGVPDDVASVLRKLHPLIKSHIRFGLSRILENPYCGKALKEKLQGLRSYKITEQEKAAEDRSYFLPEESFIGEVAVG